MQEFGIVITFANSPLGTGSVDVSKSGHTALGIVGIYYDRTSNIHLETFYIYSSNIAQVWFRRPDNGNVTMTKNINVHILYK